MPKEKYDKKKKKKKKFSYGWKFNLSQGARAVLIDDKELEEKIKKMALLAAKTINMKFGSVDIILTEDGELFVYQLGKGNMKLIKRQSIMEGVDAWGPLAYADGRLIVRDAHRVKCLKID